MKWDTWYLCGTFEAAAVRRTDPAATVLAERVTKTPRRSAKKSSEGQ